MILVTCEVPRQDALKGFGTDLW